MSNRKQRRRREKLQRHEYEYVIEDEEGEETSLERRPERQAKDGRTGARTAQAGPLDRRGRPVPKPSWQRVLRRTAIFGPLLLVVTFLTGAELSTAQKVVNALILLAFFIPFSYMVDVLVYRALMRRHNRQR